MINARMSMPKNWTKLRCLAAVFRWSAPFVFMTCSTSHRAWSWGECSWSRNIRDRRRAFWRYLQNVEVLGWYFPCLKSDFIPLLLWLSLLILFWRLSYFFPIHSCCVKRCSDQGGMSWTWLECMFSFSNNIMCLKLYIHFCLAQLKYANVTGYCFVITVLSIMVLQSTVLT